MTRGCELLGGRSLSVRRWVALLFHSGQAPHPSDVVFSSHISLFADDLSASRRNCVFLASGGAQGGDMLVKVGLVLLAVWLLGLVGVYRIGDLFHGFLLVGLMLLLLGFLHARDAAVRAAVGDTKKTS